MRRQKAMAKPKGQEGTRAAAAVEEPRFGGSSSARRGNRCGQRCALRGRATGS